MMRFPCKYQPTIVFHGFKVVQAGFKVVQDFVHPQYESTNQFVIGSDAQWISMGKTRIGTHVFVGFISKGEPLLKKRKTD